MASQELHENLIAYELAQARGDASAVDVALSRITEIAFDHHALPKLFDEAILNLLHDKPPFDPSDALEQVAKQLRRALVVNSFLFLLCNRDTPVEDVIVGALEASGLDAKKMDLDSAALTTLQNIRSCNSTDLCSRAVDFVDELARHLDGQGNELQHLKAAASAAAAAAAIESGTVYGLFVTSAPAGCVRCLNVLDVIQTSEGLCVVGVQRASEDSKGSQWDKKACYAALKLAFRNPCYRCEWGLESGEDLAMQGSSNGLALAVAVLSKVGAVPALDPYTAFTGELDNDGVVREIQDLDLKLQAATRYGIRRVFVPKDNQLPENMPKELQVLPVQHLHEVRDHLNAPWSAVTSGARSHFVSGKIALLSFLQQELYQVRDQRMLNKGTQYQVVAFHPSGDKIIVSGYPTTGNWRVENAPAHMRAKLESLFSPSLTTVGPSEPCRVAYVAPVTRVVASSEVWMTLLPIPAALRL